LNAIKLAGGIVFTENNIVTTQKSMLHAFEFDISDCPDLFPALAVLAANAQGISRIKGTNRLKYKESNRAVVIKEEYAKIGIRIDIQDDNIYITGGKISGGMTHAHNDHRIAMSLAVAALAAQSPINIEDAQCVNKSYPQFWEDFLGLLIP
jgi:3-phosphoshikimate 1-carboxyvinyltransferase